MINTFLAMLETLDVRDRHDVIMAIALTHRDLVCECLKLKGYCLNEQGNPWDETERKAK